MLQAQKKCCPDLVFACCSIHGHTQALELPVGRQQLLQLQDIKRNEEQSATQSHDPQWGAVMANAERNCCCC